MAARFRNTCRRDPTLIALRLAFLLLLCTLIVLPERAGPDGVGDAAASDARPGGVRAWVRRSVAAPGAAELDRLAARAGAAPLFAAAPAGRELLAFAPDRPRAGRNAAVDWRVRRGDPGDTVTLILSDQGGPLDSARVRLDSSGQAGGAFRVRPLRPGWHDWTVRSDGLEAAAGAWALPAAPLRVLIAGAPGSIEAREVSRALERGGATVTLATDLGRGLTLGDAPRGLARLGAPDSVAVVFVLAGVAPDRDALDRLAAFTQRGGGVLFAGASADAIAGIAAGAPAAVRADRPEWTAPADIETLPPLDTRLDVVPLQSAAGTGARLGDVPVLVLTSVGRGRAAALGVLETWRWALEAGRTDALAGFWTSLAGWLAGGARDPLSVAVDPASAPPGLPVDVRLAALDATAPRPAQLFLVRPDGAIDSLPVAWTGDHGSARFIAGANGAHEIRLARDAATASGFHADSLAPPAPDAWSRLARIAAESGGRIVPAESLDAVAGATRRASALRPVLAGLIVILALADWAVRRLRGRA